MKIERIIREPHGSVVTMGGTSYPFAPQEPGGPHVAEVENEDHARILLLITEAYRPFGDDAREKAAAITKEKPVAHMTDEELTAAMAEAAQREAAALVTTDKTDAPAVAAESADAKIEDVDISGIALADEATAADLQELNDDVLRDLFEQEVGRKPHPKMLRENMIAQIIGAREEAQ